MHIGHMIRTRRIAKNMTQEEMAYRLGVTTPAVNKWENGKTLPDISLLAPIARLLDTNIDTLLSFHETLTPEEINGYVQELDKRLKHSSYEDGFEYGKSLIEKYPNCDMLKWQIASILDAHYLFKQISDDACYEKFIYKWYVSVLESTDETIRNHAADSLFGYYIRKGEYDSAQELLTYYPEQSQERKRKQAEIYQRSGKIEEAYKAYEELLFSYYQMSSMVFRSLCDLAVKDNDLENAHYYLEKQESLAKLFEMGKYHEVSGRMNFAFEEDENAIQKMVNELLECIDTITAFRNAPLYRHMTFKQVEPGFIDEMKTELLGQLKSEGYTVDDEV